MLRQNSLKIIIQIISWSKNNVRYKSLNYKTDKEKSREFFYQICMQSKSFIRLEIEALVSNIIFRPRNYMDYYFEAVLSEQKIYRSDANYKITHSQRLSHIL